MTFKRRLVISFTIVLVLPLLLCTVSFFLIGNYLTQSEDSPVQFHNYQDLTGTLQTDAALSASVFEEVMDKAAADPSALEDKNYLGQINNELKDKNSFVFVRKDEAVYYSGNEKASTALLSQLPGYTGKTVSTDGSEGYYIANANKVVKQIDFTFSDGAEGSFFIVTRVVTLMSRSFLISMFTAMAVILVITALFLTNWMNRGVIEPINLLNTAMRNIRDGNLTYMLPAGEKGEIGDLYQNYEDMRLRLKESADEKMEQEKQSRELVSNIAHDLKTPITSVKGYAEGLLDGVANTPEKQQKYLQTIVNKANDMNRLINELTLYSKIDSDKIPYNFHRINVTDYFGDCVEEIGMDMESRGIELNYSNMVSPDTVIIADPEQLKRVINNIISNSVKYMDKPKCRIDIRILDEQDGVRIEIEDNGKGIAARDLPNIFDRFYRTDSSRNSAQGGSGIGLSIVKKIVEDHGGYIWATSREGEGTCMHIVMRKYRGEEAAEKSVDAAASEKV
jgi:signal transduction histidine kinase